MKLNDICIDMRLSILEASIERLKAKNSLGGISPPSESVLSTKWIYEHIFELTDEQIEEIEVEEMEKDTSYWSQLAFG